MRPTEATADADRTGELEFPIAFQVQSRDPARLGKEQGRDYTIVPKKGRGEGAGIVLPNIKPKSSPAGVPQRHAGPLFVPVPG